MSRMQALKHNLLGAICATLIICFASACATPKAPLVKWWFNDFRDEKSFVRKECDGDKCEVKERLSYEQADSYFAISPQDFESLLSYIKNLERECR